MNCKLIKTNKIKQQVEVILLHKCLHNIYSVILLLKLNNIVSSII